MTQPEPCAWCGQPIGSDHEEYDGNVFCSPTCLECWWERFDDEEEDA